MIALIDCDILLYRIGFTTQTEEEWIAKVRFDEMVESILAETGSTEYQLWLSDKTSNNFRTRFYPEYKQNRKDFVPPVHYDLLKEHAINEWGAKITLEQEADDALGIEQTRFNGYLENPEYGMMDRVSVPLTKTFCRYPETITTLLKRRNSLSLQNKDSSTSTPNYSQVTLRITFKDVPKSDLWELVGCLLAKATSFNSFEQWSMDTESPTEKTSTLKTTT